MPAIASKFKREMIRSLVEYMPIFDFLDNHKDVGVSLKYQKVLF